MTGKRWALMAYILIAGFGLWITMSTAAMLAVGIGQPVIDMLSNGATVGVTVVGGIIIYILGGTKDELPK